MNALVPIPGAGPVQFVTADDLRAHYKAVRKRLETPKPFEVEGVEELMLAVWLRSICWSAVRQAWQAQVRAETLRSELINKYGSWAFGARGKAAAVAKIATIQYATAAEFNLPIGRILSESRTAPVSEARQVAMYLCHHMTSHSYLQIGRNFSRDHSTVIHGVRHIEARLERDPDFARRVARLRLRIETRGGRG